MAKSSVVIKMEYRNYMPVHKVTLWKQIENDKYEWVDKKYFDSKKDACFYAEKKYCSGNYHHVTMNLLHEDITDEEVHNFDVNVKKSKSKHRHKK